MAYSVWRTNRFNTQLEAAIDYLVNKLHSPQAAKALLDAYEQKLHLIKTTPTWLAVDEQAGKHFGTTIYKTHVRSYIMRYWVDQERETVRLLSFRHESQDYTSYEEYGQPNEN